MQFEQPLGTGLLSGQPSKTVFTLDMVAYDGWTTPVTLTFDPANAQVLGIVGLTRKPATETTVSTLIVAPAEQVYLVAVTTADTPLGMYLLYIDAQGGGKQQSLDLRLSVGSGPISFTVYLPLVMKIF
ncbi:MAG TPA: hypothetical protein VFF70_01320 [Anaerolineae bacterium]|nr:hypothetical protein [Anaerolineae bacterium]